MYHNYYNGLSEDLRNGLNSSLDGSVNGIYGTETSPVILDIDVVNFISIVGIKNGIQIIALNNLARGLKHIGVWERCTVIYPFIGSDATTHGKNLKNPNIFNITFNGTWTHAETGAKPNTSASSFATSGLTPSVDLVLNDTHMSYYSRTQNTETGCEIGVNSFDASKSFQMGLNYNGVGKFAELYNQTAGSGRIVLSNTNTLGLQLASRTSGTDFRLYFNGIQVGATSTGGTIGTLSTGSLEINGSNGANNHSNKECAFVSIGKGISQEQAASMYKIVQKYQALLRRAV